MNSKKCVFSHDWKKNIFPTNMANPIFLLLGAVLEING